MKGTNQNRAERAVKANRYRQVSKVRFSVNWIRRLTRLAILSRQPSRTPNLGRFRIKQTAKLFPTGSACAGQPYDPASSTAAMSN
jgi:hypothetical protein